MAEITDKQRTVLKALVEADEPQSVRELADTLEGPGRGSEVFSGDEVRGLLERLETAGFVQSDYERPGSPGVAYKPTEAGQAAVQE